MSDQFPLLGKSMTSILDSPSMHKAQIMSEIDEVLRNHEIIVSEQVDVISQCKPGYPNNSDKLLSTLFIGVDVGNTNPIQR